MRTRAVHSGHYGNWVPNRLERGDPKIVERLRQVLYMGGQLHPVERPRGVHRFQTIADAQAWRAAWEGRRQAES